jgi:hypothetical protein
MIEPEPRPLTARDDQDRDLTAAQGRFTDGAGAGIELADWNRRDTVFCGNSAHLVPASVELAQHEKVYRRQLLGQIATLGFAELFVPGQHVILTVFLQMVSEFVHREVLDSLAVS